MRRRRTNRRGAAPRRRARPPAAARGIRRRPRRCGATTRRATSRAPPKRRIAAFRSRRRRTTGSKRTPTPSAKPATEADDALTPRLHPRRGRIARSTAATERRMQRESTLDLGVIGNGTVAALVDPHARIVWCCLPAFDGDPTFCALLQPVRHDGGDFAVELVDQVSAEQRYVDNSAVLVTVLRDAHGGAVEVTDLAPRWKQFGRIVHPMSLLRRVRPLAGSPMLRLRLRPLAEWGGRVPERTAGSNHVRFLLGGWTLRATADVPLPLLLDGHAFVLDREVHVVLGPDETLAHDVGAFFREQLDLTVQYWREWVRSLALPFDLQDYVIRASFIPKHF